MKNFNQKKQTNIYYIRDWWWKRTSNNYYDAGNSDTISSSILK